MKIQYETTAVSTGGRSGKVIVENSPLEFEMAPPAEMGGNRVGVNPEQLFAAGYSACFGGAVHHVIRARRLSVQFPSVHVKVGLGKDDADANVLAVDITAIFKDINQETADALVNEAHQICPYSRATRGNIDVKVSARVE